MKTLLSGMVLLLVSSAANAMSPGEYVAKAADCTACHTAPGGAALAGGGGFPLPPAGLSSAQIYPPRQTGVGSVNVG